MARQRDPKLLRVYSKKHYEKNRAAMIARAKVTSLKTRDLARKHILDYLTKHPCVDCGEADPIVLEFDHIAGRGEKMFSLGVAVQRGYGLAKIDAEIEKCDVRCANCHRRKTYVERALTNKG